MHVLVTYLKIISNSFDSNFISFDYLMIPFSSKEQIVNDATNLKFLVVLSLFVFNFKLDILKFEVEKVLGNHLESNFFKYLFVSSIFLSKNNPNKLYF